MDGLRHDGPERVLVEARLGFEPTPGAMLYPTRMEPDGTRAVLSGFRHPGGSVGRAIGRRYRTGEYELQVRDRRPWP